MIALIQFARYSGRTGLHSGMSHEPSFRSQGGHRIDTGGAASGDRDRQESSAAEQERRCYKGDGIPGFDSEKDSTEKMRQPQSCADADNDTDDGKNHSLSDNHVAKSGSLRTEGHANAKLLGTLLNGVGHDAVNADRSHEQRRAAEDDEQKHVETFAGGSDHDNFFHRADVRDRQPSTTFTQSNGNGLDEGVRFDVGTNDPPEWSDARIERGNLVGHLRNWDVHRGQGILI